MKNFGEIDQAIRTVCPILGIAFRRLDDKSTWIINYADDSTPEQRAAADAMLQTLELRDVVPQPDRVEMRLRALEQKAGITPNGVLVE